MVFTINEMGVDTEGIIHDYIKKNNLIYINWCVDDPFYEEIMLKKKSRKYSGRIDFVSDNDYVDKMRSAGFKAFFMPLATDPGIYYPMNLKKEVQAAFVGNSYLKQIDVYTKGFETLFDEMFPYLVKIIYLYRTNTELDIEYMLFEKISSLNISPDIKIRKAVFVFKHLASYMHRKETVKQLAESIDGFQVFGDSGWLREIDKQKLGRVAYGDTLRELYNRTAVNIDINRIVIRNGFTQRVFDALACNSFIITSEKRIVKEFFESEGTKRELVTFRFAEELKDLVNYYLKHETERELISQRGYQKVKSMHTYDHRISEMFKIISKEL